MRVRVAVFGQARQDPIARAAGLNPQPTLFRWSRRAVVLLALGVLLARGPACRKNAAQPGASIETAGVGAAIERLTKDPADETRPALSPDGEILLFGASVFEAGVERTTLVGIDPGEKRSARIAYAPHGGDGFDPAWSADSSWYVYVVHSPGPHRVLRALVSSPQSEPAVVLGGDAAWAARAPSLSPDGNRVAFAALSSGSDHVAIVNIDGTQLRWLGEGDSPAWSPDGKRLAFGRAMGSHHQILLVNPDTGGPVVQLTTGDFDHFDPAWSPDGQFIVLSRAGTDQQPEGNGRNLFIVQADGTGLTQLTSGTSRAVTPCWGRDDWIYFASDAKGSYDIWRVRPIDRYSGLQPVLPPSTAASVAPTQAGPADAAAD
jgi:TolB protein